MFSKEKNIPYLLLTPALAILISLTIYPMFYSINVALREFYLSKPYLGKPFVGFQNFISLFHDQNFLMATKTTFIFMGTVVPVEFLVGLAIALLLRTQRWEHTIFSSVIILPMVMTPVIVALMWRLMYHPTIGVINYLLNLLGISRVLWLAEPTLALVSVMLVDIWQWTPFVIIIMLAGLVSLPEAPFEAAKIDGASGWKTLVYVTLPMLRPVILVTILLRSIDAFKIFDTVYTLTGGGPGLATETLTLYTYRLAFKYFNMGKASALSYLMLIMVIFFSTTLINIIIKQERERM